MNETLFKGMCLKSQGTGKDALCEALRRARLHGVTNRTLTSQYEVTRPTLAKIEKGTPLTKNRDRYLEAFVVSLNDMRLAALCRGDTVMADAISKDLRDILLIFCGIGTDDEMWVNIARKRNRQYH